MKLTCLGDGQKIEAPNGGDTARIEAHIQVIAQLMRERYGFELTRTDADLPLIQRVLDVQVFNKSYSYELQALGLVFGEAIRGKLGLQWVMIDDIYGRTPALQFRSTSLIAFPLPMISKRIERGEPVDLLYLALALQRTIDERLDRAGSSTIGKDTLLKKLRRKLPF